MVTDTGNTVALGTWKATINWSPGRIDVEIHWLEMPGPRLPLSNALMV